LKLLINLSYILKGTVSSISTVRNLKTLEVDLGTFERLVSRAREAGTFLVAESGVHSPEDARRMVQAGADELLVGTELMGRPRGWGIVKRSAKELWTKI
jgi:indole-3-glycerol phosphate synthase